MTRKILKKPHILIGCMGIASSPLYGIVLEDPDHVVACQGDFAGDLRACDTSFGPGTDQEPNENADPVLHQSCTDGAEAKLIACLDHANTDGLSDAWDEFIRALESCADAPNQTTKNACINGALIVFRYRISEALQNPNEICGAEQFPASGAEIQSLKSTSGGNAFLEISTNSTTSFTAGVSTDSSTPYDVKNSQCLKNAIMLAVYATKTGNVTQYISADTDLSDGVNFNYFSYAPNLVDAKSVTLVIAYFDQNTVPVFVEYADLSLSNSPISGDWNRDQTKNSTDVLDYLGSLGSEVARADINNDGVVNELDAVDFLVDFTQ